MVETPWSLQITPEEFKTLFPGVPEYLFRNKPSSDVEMLEEFLPYRLWRLNSLYTIVDKWGKRIPFRLKWAQLVVYSQYLRHPRLIILKSRQQGISTLWLIIFFDISLVLPDMSLGLMAQGKRESAMLLTRTKLLWDTLDVGVKSFLLLTTVKDNTESVKLSNGSQILIGVSFRSQTLQGLHISEFGKIANENPKRAEETKTGSLQALAPSNPAIIESTGEGDNEFKTMWDLAEALKPSERGPKDFLPIFLSWWDDPDCSLDVLQSSTRESSDYFHLHESSGWTFTQEQKNWWISQFREIGTKIFQEYPLTAEEAFKASRQGSYWHPAWKEFGIIGPSSEDEIPALYEPRLPIYAVMDLGINDTNSIKVFQYFNNVRTIIWEYDNNNQGVRHYAKRLKRLALLLKTELPELWLPHDGKKRSQVDLKTAEQAYSEEGFIVSMLERPQSKLQAINHVRNEIELSFLRVDLSCPYTIATFANYSREWDTKLGQWKREPRKDEWDHIADSIIYMTMIVLVDPYNLDYKAPTLGPNSYTV